MNYRIVKKDMTAHHIKKREDGGLLTIDNIAPLMDVAHQYLHLIECKDIEAYVVLNKVFKMANEQGHEPTEGQRQMVEYVLREFEKYHREDKNSKGKILIREEFLIRGYHL